MNKILNELDEIFQLVSAISVKGDSVDIMAAARSKLRNVYSELKTIELSSEKTE